ncbi:GIY-YIG nuclease family protein [Aspergillus homomorphus CBS 101889]|uniref:Bacteriophage T5 Orf172 DNA-binding domain-containing protein n=1 Tax=Aspergillus homomorphus (strain CBS 101889) TaxID=1450537 RepID=A0A395I0Y7_ASPHC|nr:hypothetical protein BO97DRAFT_405104 [Aspergillus homomorphus CBS 101889]RAL13273.1 hypothetical protein BO97DRAFT_405104 [Aspergillus homomorphus CBS 101889]
MLHWILSVATLLGASSKDYPPVTDSPLVTTQDGDAIISAQVELDSEEEEFEDDLTSNKPRSLKQEVESMAKIFNRKYKYNKGKVYIFSDPKKKDTEVKIGSTRHVRSRGQNHLKCRPTWTISHTAETREYMRVEALVRTEIRDKTWRHKCRCGTVHTEYFTIEQDVAVEFLKFWCTWLKRENPFTRDAQLKPFWLRRLRLFEARFLQYFICQSCGENDELAQDQRRTACPECLREGWKAWVNPTYAERKEYMHQCIQEFHSPLIKIRDSLSKSAYCFLSTICLRLLIPIIFHCIWISVTLSEGRSQAFVHALFLTPKNTFDLVVSSILLYFLAIAALVHGPEVVETLVPRTSPPPSTPGNDNSSNERPTDESPGTPTKPSRPRTGKRSPRKEPGSPPKHINGEPVESSSMDMTSSGSSASPRASRRQKTPAPSSPSPGPPTSPSPRPAKSDSRQ